MAAKTRTNLEDLDLPDWFVGAADELKSTNPRWVKHLPAVSLRSGDELPVEAQRWIFGALVFSEAESIRPDMVDLLKRHADLSALDRWMTAAIEAWIAAASPIRDAWVLTGVSYFGGDLTVRRINEAIRQWSKEKNRVLAVRGLDVLSRIGSKAALEQISMLSAIVRDHGVADEAQHAIERKATVTGTSRSAVEDNHVAKLGLDERGARTLEYGNRSFRAVLGKNLNLDLFDREGRKRKALPPIAATDDRAVAEASQADWAELKMGMKRVLKAQLKRFEQAMTTGTPWTVSELRSRILPHPILCRIAQLLVWQTINGGQGGFRVTEDLTFADLADSQVLLDNECQVRVAHPLRLSSSDLKAWVELFADYEVIQPFQQLARSVNMCDPSQTGFWHIEPPAHQPLKPGVLYGILDNDGWRLGPPMEGVLNHSWKCFVADRVTAIITYSGMYPGSIAKSPEQTIKHCSFLDGAMLAGETRLPAKALELGEVPPVAFSETMRRLLRLTSIVS